MSIWGSGYSDEPFTIRDIQFDNPQVGVLIAAPRQPFIQFTADFRVFPARERPGASSVRLRHAFIDPRIGAAFGQDDKDCARIAFTFMQHAGKAAFGPGAADQCPDHEVGGKARFTAQPADACIAAA